jgi:hypothetical protein
MVKSVTDVRVFAVTGSSGLRNLRVVGLVVAQQLRCLLAPLPVTPWLCTTPRPLVQDSGFGTSNDSLLAFTVRLFDLNQAR